MKPLRSLALFVPVFICVGCNESSTETDAVPRWSLEEVFRKDGVSDPEVPLSRVLAVLPGPGGEILVTQWMVPEVLVLDSTGAFVRTVGRAGNGPGEFLGPSALGWWGDTLWVGDSRGARIQLFDEEWESAGTIQFIILPDSDDRYASGLAPSRLLPDGSVLAAASISIEAASRGMLGGMATVRANWDGEVLDTVAVIHIPSRDFLTIRVPGDQGIATVHPVQTMSKLVPAGHLPSFYLVDRPIPAHPDSALILIHRIDLHGDTLWSRRHAWPAVSVSEEFKQRWYDLMAPSDQDAPPGYERLEMTLREEVDFPEYLPAVTNAHTARNGDLWIKTPRAESDSSSWLVFDTLGTAIGRVRTVEGLSVEYTDGGVLWGTIRDDLDVPILIRFRIHRDH